MQDGSKVTTTKAYKMHNFPEESRDFTVGALMLKRLGVSRATLYSNSDRKAEALEQNRIRVVARKSLTFADLVKNNEILRHDLADKRDNLGHSGLRDYADLN
jgi:GTP cyclohydrolase II